MILGLRTVIYPVTDLARGKAWYAGVLGATVGEALHDVGEGIKVASVADPFGNTFALIENPHFSAAAVR